MEKRRKFKPGNCTFFSGKGSENCHFSTRSFEYHKTVSAVTRVEFVSEGMSCIVLRGCWCNIVVLNEHAPSKERNAGSKERFYATFDNFLKYHIKIL